MSKRAIILARVSTKEQRDNFSLPSQFAAGRQYCAQNNFVVIEEIADVYTGNSAVADRPGGAKVYDYLRRRAVDAVVVYTLDRTARDDDALEYAIFKRDVKRAGAELHFVDTGKAADDLFGGLIEQFKAVGAAEERKRIIERMTRGRRTKAAGDDTRAGRWVGIGRPCYGYKRVGKGKDVSLTFDEAERPIVERIIELYIGKDGTPPVGMVRIAKTLSAEGVPPPNRGPGGAQFWHMESIRTILANTAYMGHFNNGGVTIYLPELAIIDVATWEKIQKRRERNSVAPKRNQKYDYLLTGGHLRCTCGASMSARGGRMGKKGRLKFYSYYVCWREARRYTGLCSERSLRSDVVDEAVWSWLSNLLLDEGNLDIGIKQMIERREVELSPKRERLGVVEELIGEAELGVKNLASGLRRAKNETVANVLQDDLDKLGRHLTELNEERAILLAYIGQDELNPEEVAAIKQTVADLRSELQNPDLATKRYLVDRLNVRVELKRDDTSRWLEVTCGIAPAPDRLSIATGTSSGIAPCSLP